MRPPLHRVLKWLVPGLRIKRWIALAFVSMGLIVIGALYAFGVDVARALYRAIPLASFGRNSLTIALIAAGLSGFSLSLVQLVRSVARALAPGVTEKPSALIYRRRILDRGPKVVAVGGGTGLSTLLRGLKQMTSNITAVVTVMDDGGSSGRLRRQVDVLPPGDVRNCLLALADDEERLSNYFQYRLTAPEELAGHALGNLLLVGLEQATGSFDRAVEAMSHVLKIRGRVLPATLDNAQLSATMDDGFVVTGESRIVSDPRRIKHMALLPNRVSPHAMVLEAINEADLILLGPGSLFTSLIPNLLIDGVAAAIEEAAAEKMLVANLMTQHGETDSLTLGAHLRILNEYIRLSRFDHLLVNSEIPSSDFLTKYRHEEAEPVVDDLEDPNEFGLIAIREDLLGTAKWAGKETVKHDPEKLARAIAKHTQAFAQHRRSSDTEDAAS
ncbi:YvcK family protein [Candidatus Bipolaricaulota bacterium]|nr:YvcK family protein [Candidatus Bipolaricaulota bacterium]